ncbi:MAG: 1-deoxy-D-xylulose-5-phosphate synthase [Proteobacteria bacterium]|nr:1-deoxy-D-xylulose-5-phosphate synthase [Pseudomonadota bacterium]NCA27840.1 1-deoxy-D-xylulose-5-phosphate synthase [Pseudomonadota bacterium]
MTNRAKSTTPLLDKVNFPSDLKQFSIDEIKQISDELRQETIANVAKTGGHLGAGLGVVELTCALHYVFDTPFDKLIWDVGHQAYPHKILTGRRHKMHTIRKPNGLAGFTRREESEYDPFGAGHSSTSISAGLGISVAKKFKQEKSHVIAVIGDGAMSAGMAFEALNNAGALEAEYFNDNRLIVILNDNDMSIAPPTGAMSHYLSRIVSSKSYLKIRDISKKFIEKLPQQVGKYPRKFEKSIKEWWMGGNIFEELGFYYIGPIDGHNLDILIPILQNIRADKSSDPILIHCVTQKGKGLTDKMQSSDKLHAVSSFDPSTGIQQKSSSQFLTFSKIFGTKLAKKASIDDKILAITAAMPSGTGLDVFAKDYPSRIFDVGIAEQHAVTFSAGLASEGMKPFCAIYSTFLQRAYDQIIHDVALQKLPVRFAIDRAGFVGADGPTHAGSFDLAYLVNIPNFVVMAPSNGQELVKMINTAQNIDYCPSAFRFPRAEANCDIDFNDNEILEIGKAKILQNGSKVAVMALGTILENVIEADKILKQQHNLEITIVDARFAKPFDEELVLNLVKTHQLFITIEEGVIGGFGSLVGNFLHNSSFLDEGKCKFRSLFMKDEFIEQDDIAKMRIKGDLGVDFIVDLIAKSL